MRGAFIYYVLFKKGDYTIGNIQALYDVFWMNT